MDTICGKIGYNATKNCFLCLPDGLKTQQHSGEVHVFELEVDGRSKAYCSWSGDTTTAGSQTIFINDLYANKLEIPEDTPVVLRRLSGVVDCDRVQVEPLSVDDWEILDMHSGYVESHLLDQLRVVWSGQTFPVWVNKSTCTFLKIGSVSPPSHCALLVNNTEVIVNHKSRSDAKRLPFAESSELSRSAIVQSGNSSTNQMQTDVSQSKMNKSSSNSSEKKDMQVDEGFLNGMTNYFKSFIWTTNNMTESKTLLTSKEDSTSILQSNFKLGFRVQSLCLQSDTAIFNSPTNVFVLRSNFTKKINAFSQNKLEDLPCAFYAKISKLLSPEEKRKENEAKEAEKPKNTEPSKTTEKSNETVKKKAISTPTAMVRVIMISDFDHGLSSEYSGLLQEVNRLQPVLEDHVVVSDFLRRQLKLDVTGQVQLESVSYNPAPIESLHLFQISDLPPSITNEMVVSAFRSWLTNTLSNQPALVVFQQMLIWFPIMPDIPLEVLVTFDPSKTSQSNERSYTIIQMNMCQSLSIVVRGRNNGRRKWPEISHHPVDNVSEFDPPVPRFSLDKLGGVQELVGDALTHIEMAFGLRPLTQAILPSLIGLRTGALLVTGNSGTGKSSLVKALCRRVAEYPCLAYTEVVECKTLKGKRPETILKLLEKLFDELSWRQPAVVLIDDVDVLAGSFKSPDAEMSGEAQYSYKLSEVFRNIVKTEMVNKSRIAVIFTAKSHSSVHPSLTSARGLHVIQKVIELKPPKQTERLEILQAILGSKPFLPPKSITELPLSSLAVKMEGFIAQDIRSVVDRAIHAHHMTGETESEMCLTSEDFEAALEDFTPASYRNVSLYEETEVGWQDIGGLKEVKTTLVETLQWPTKYPELFANCPLRLRSGLLLFGAPGTGKTLLARAVAKECGLNFISIKGPELLSKYIGASEQAVRDTFTRAQSAKPCILFFDEFDSIAPRRGHDSTGVTDRVVNQLLTQLDGVEGLDGVYVLGASSRPDLIDPALLRPGRLDKCLFCQLPSEEERLEILTSLAKKMKFADDVNLEEISKQCDNFTGADFKALLYNAQLEAIHEITPSLREKSDVVIVDKDLEKRTQLVCQSLPSLQKSSQEPKAAIEYPTQLVLSENRSLTYIPRLEDGPVLLEPEHEKQILSQINRLEQNTARLQKPFVHGNNKTSNIRTKMLSHMVQVNQSHLIKAVNGMGPSVSTAERAEYQKRYSNFVSSRGGDFDESSPTSGKRLTLA